MKFCFFVYLKQTGKATFVHCIKQLVGLIRLLNKLYWIYLIAQVIWTKSYQGDYNSQPLANIHTAWDGQSIQEVFGHLANQKIL